MIARQHFTVENGIVVADFCACNCPSDFHRLVGLEEKITTLKDCRALGLIKLRSMSTRYSREMGANWDDKRAALSPATNFGSDSTRPGSAVEHIAEAVAAVVATSLV